MQRAPAAWQRLLLAALATGAALGGVSAAQPVAAWKTGPAFRQQLDAPLSLTWSERPLRDGLSNLSQITGVAIFLDRRIDPGQNLQLSAAAEPLSQLLGKIGGQTKAKVATVGPVVYLGPQATADVLATVAAIRRQEVASLAPEAKMRLLRTQSWQWNELAQPRQLLAELAQQANVAVHNSELISHDLWPAQNLPPLPWVDRLSLLLAGFGLTFEIDKAGTAIRLANLPESAVLEKTYATRSGAPSLAAQLRTILPGAKITAEPGKLRVAATLEDHDKIERLLLGQSVATTKSVKPAAGEKRYTLTVENQPSGAVLRTVANSLGKELKYDTAVLQKLKSQATFTVKDATLDELLKKTLDPLGLTYKQDDKSLEIVAP